MSTTLRNPRVPFSEAIALLKKPGEFNRTAVIALVYRDRGHLQHDYDRTAKWRRVAGATGVVHSTYLEKPTATREDDCRAYLDFGWRRYQGSRVYEERLEDRITVPMLGGSNRRSVIAMLERTDDMAIIFSLVPTFEDVAAMTRLSSLLSRGGFPTADGTVATPIKGLTIFGRFRPVGESVTPTGSK